jgi:ABC-type phosphate/phosphonate transport system substrate-binding protein
VAPVNTTTTKVGRGAPATAGDNNEEILPVYYSQLYVHKKSTYNTLQELQGCIFAYNDDASLSGYHCLRFLLKQYATSSTTTKTNNKNDEKIEEEEEEEEQKNMNEITIPFFSRAICTGGHLLSIKAIALGDADVACIDCVVVQDLLAKAAAASASADDNDDTTTSCQNSSLWYFNQLRPLHAPSQFVHYTKGNTSRHEKSLSLSVQEEEVKRQPLSLHNDDGRIGPNPAQPIVISKNINIDLRYRIQEAYLSLHKYVSLSSINATHFVSVTSQHYESIDSMMKECEGLDIICPNESSMMEEVEDDVLADNK